MDEANGGFYGLVDLEGRPVPGADKDLIQQVRHLWSFSQIFRFIESSESIARICHQQFRFVRDCFYDPASNWFHRRVSAEGEPGQGQVHHYPVAFCIFGLSNFATAFSGRESGSEALELVNRVFEKVVRESWDPENGFDETRYPGGWSREPKEINTQMHLLEAVGELFEANQQNAHPGLAPSQRVFERQVELIGQKAIVHMSGETFCSKAYREDWTLIDHHEVEYGHDIEVVYLLWQSASRLGWQDDEQITEPLLALARSTSRRAFDRRLGKWYYSGAPLTGRPRKKTANIWTQFEALNGLMVAYRLSSEPEFLTMFDRVLEWLDTKQRHPRLGEWYYNVDSRGRPLIRGVYGEPCGWMSFPWKSSYHSFRALIACKLWLQSEIQDLPKA